MCKNLANHGESYGWYQKFNIIHVAFSLVFSSFNFGQSDFDIWGQDYSDRFSFGRLTVKRVLNYIQQHNKIISIIHKVKQWIM